MAVAWSPMQPLANNLEFSDLEIKVVVSINPATAITQIMPNGNDLVILFLFVNIRLDRSSIMRFRFVMHKGGIRGIREK